MVVVVMLVIVFLVWINWDYLLLHNHEGLSSVTRKRKTSCVGAHRG